MIRNNQFQMRVKRKTGGVQCYCIKKRNYLEVSSDCSQCFGKSSGYTIRTDKQTGE